jgi:RNA polymerase sigma-70 factor (ECF subfamily)
VRNGDTRQGEILTADESMPGCQGSRVSRVRSANHAREAMSEYVVALTSPVSTRRDVWKEVRAITEDRDTELFERHLAGDDGALVELFNAHNNRLYVYCLKLVGSAAAAEDITQEVWERIVRMRLDAPSLRNPAGFFIRMARNLSLNVIRDRRKLSSLDEVGEAALPSVGTRERSEMEEIVELALARLPFEYREVLILNAYSGYNHEEIAAMLGKTPQAIWKRASRAREKLRAIVVTMMPATGELEGAGASSTDAHRARRAQ